MKTRILFAPLFLLGACLHLQAAEPAYLTAAEITFDPPGTDGLQVVTVRMTPRGDALL